MSLALVVSSALADPFLDAVVLDVGDHAVALPFGHLPVQGPLGPALDAGVEHRWVEGGAFALAQDARLGAFDHVLFGTSATLGTDLLARVTLPAGPTAEAGLGVGGSYAWRAREVLAWDEEAGTYAPAADPGRPGLTAGFVLGLGYDLGEVTAAPLAVQLRYQWFVQGPFLPALPLGPQGILSVGLRWTVGGAA